MSSLDASTATIIASCSGSAKPTCADEEIAGLLADCGTPLAVVDGGQGYGLVANPKLTFGGGTAKSGKPAYAWLPATPLNQLGDPGFCRDHGLRYPYMCGAMANGIASARICIAMAEAGMLGSYGAGGQSIDRVRSAIHEIRAALGEHGVFAVNLIHSPHEPAHEEAMVDLLLDERVGLIEASAYLDLTPAAVRYRVSGIGELPDGSVHTPNRIIAKASRVEVARRWLSPPPERMLKQLVAKGHISPLQAQLASRIPMADDLTAEADSGGHTDNRAAIALYPTFLALAERLRAEHGYATAIRIGAAGGIATPAAAAAAFGMGVAYICTGSINQACVESGSCDHVRAMLAEVDQADVCMAPAADMFEMGVKLQVVRRGTMFPQRAEKLYQLYSNYDSWEAIPAAERQKVEQTIFRRSFADVWRDTEAFWEKREVKQAERARSDAKRRMALCFRWYLGLSSIWANSGDPERQLDYQVWAGPAMGAFNEWCRDSFLAEPANRNVASVARNLLYGAARHQRLAMLRAQGIRIAPALAAVDPVSDDHLREIFA